MSDSTHAETDVPKNRQSLIQIPYYEEFFLERYKVYFSVTTDCVIQRVKDSLFPFTKNPLFFDSVIDLYGPLWVYFTLNVCIVIFGYLCAYIDKVVFGMQEDYVMQMHKFSKIFIVLSVYFFLIPLALNFMFFFAVGRYPGYARLLAIYGYSFTIYIPMTLIYVIPSDQLRWVILSLAGMISLFCICKELLGTMVNNLDPCKVKLICVLQCILHLCFTLLLKYYFFV